MGFVWKKSQMCCDLLVFYTKSPNMCVVLALMKTSKSTENSETKETYAAWAIKFSCPDPKREGFDGQRIFVARQIIVAGHPCGQ